MSDLPLLIIAQSARFLAQAASLAGYRVWAADCFADVDACNVAERWQLLAPFDQLTTDQLLSAIINLSQGEPCQLIYGGGIEHYLPLFDKLPNHIQLMGNSPQALKMVNHPPNFFALLDKLKLPFPELNWQRPARQTAWLFKPNVSLGGNNILPAQQTTTTNQGYFQRQIAGTSLSALFLANGSDSQVIGINRQWAASIPESPFRLGGIEKPYMLTVAVTKQIMQAIQVITRSTGLVGLNSLDFMASDDGRLYLLEINPRPSASAELYQSQLPLINAHLSACQRHPLNHKIELDRAPFHLLSYLYATTQSIVVPNQFSWPSVCRDIPIAGAHISKQQPICTLLIPGKTLTLCHQKRQQLEIKITSELAAS